MQRAITALKDYPRTYNCVFVASEVPAYSLKLTYFFKNNVLMQVNESVLRHASDQLSCVPKNTEVVTGYGTGGAVAMMIAFLLDIKHVVTFGSPPVGDNIFNDMLVVHVSVTRVKL